MQKRFPKLFPNGTEKVAVADCHGPPVDGVWIREQNQRLLDAGLARGDVIVAINGTRVHNLMQYEYLRNFQQSPGLNLIAWHAEAYHEIKCSPPNRRFGVMFDTYRARPAR